MVTLIWSIVSSLICRVSLAAHKPEGTGTYLVVGSVDKNLVKDLEETGNKGRVSDVSLIVFERDLPIDHHLCCLVIHPHHLGDCLH
jgi:hypothetical protein